MRTARLLRKMRTKWEEIWALPKVKLTFVIVATALGTGTYYQPIVKTLFFSKPKISEEQLAYYEKDNLYPIKIRKQKEQEMEQRIINSRNPQSP